MPLTEFCYIPSVATDAFYTPEEQAIHNRLLKLYTLRMREKDGQNRKWRVSSINRVIKKYKDELVGLLKKSLEDNIIRELNPDAVTDKTIINLFSFIPPNALIDSMVNPHIRVCSTAK